MKAPDPSEVAASFHRELKATVTELKQPVRLVGFLTHEGGPSQTYAEYTRRGCESVGVEFELRQVSRLNLETELARANADPAVHGILIYYPVFGTGQDSYLKDLVDYRKDVEGFSTFWVRKLYANDRFANDDRTAKAILPCTPLAVVKMLSAAGALDDAAPDPAGGKIVTVFNRSEVVGRPLATMLANDGAKVFSFDVDGAIVFERGKTQESSIPRADALKQSNIVITGVPAKSFPPVTADEILPGAVCLNFSTLKNFASDIETKAGVFIPRVGPVTVAMCLRNTLRLFQNFHRAA